jgi:hypothetical protein
VGKLNGLAPYVCVVQVNMLLLSPQSILNKGKKCQHNRKDDYLLLSMKLKLILFLVLKERAGKKFDEQKIA